MIRHPHTPSRQATSPSQNSGLEIQSAFKTWRIGFSRFTVRLEPSFLCLGQHVYDVATSLQQLAAAAAIAIGARREKLARPVANPPVTEAWSVLALAVAELQAVIDPLFVRNRASSGWMTGRAINRTLTKVGALVRTAAGILNAPNSSLEGTADLELIADIGELASQLGTLTDSRHSGAHWTNRVRLRKHVEGLHYFAEGLLESMTGASEQTYRLLAQIDESLAHIEQHRQDISRQTGSIVHHLQCGDLIRQQCEQVLESAQELCGTDDEVAHCGGRFGLGSPTVLVAQLNIIQEEIDEAHQLLTVSYAKLGEHLDTLIACGRQLESKPREAGFSRREALRDLLVISSKARHTLNRAIVGVDALHDLGRQFDRYREDAEAITTHASAEGRLNLSAHASQRLAAAAHRLFAAGRGAPQDQAERGQIGVTESEDNFELF